MTVTEEWGEVSSTATILLLEFSILGHGIRSATIEPTGNSNKKIKMTEIVTVQTPPLLQPPVPQGPSEKEKKYDRQLRLWAANGQAALESAHLLLFNTGSGTVGVETLKNLVLPGKVL